MLVHGDTDSTKDNNPTIFTENGVILDEQSILWLINHINTLSEYHKLQLLSLENGTIKSHESLIKGWIYLLQWLLVEDYSVANDYLNSAESTLQSICEKADYLSDPKALELFKQEVSQNGLTEKLILSMQLPSWLNEAYNRLLSVDARHTKTIPKKNHSSKLKVTSEQNSFNPSPIKGFKELFPQALFNGECFGRLAAQIVQRELSEQEQKLILEQSETDLSIPACYHLAILRENIYATNGDEVNQQRVARQVEEYACTLSFVQSSQDNNRRAMLGADKEGWISSSRSNEEPEEQDRDDRPRLSPLAIETSSSEETRLTNAYKNKIELIKSACENQNTEIYVATINLLYSMTNFYEENIKNRTAIKILSKLADNIFLMIAMSQFSIVKKAYNSSFENILRISNISQKFGRTKKQYG